MITEGASITKPLAVRTHTVIIGSGAGGAVVAKHLAEAGNDTIVLEEGGRFTASDFSQRDDQMYPLLYRSGGTQLTEDGLINVLQGSCYGGSTVINMADCVPSPPEVLAHWQQRFGLAEITEEALAPSVERVLRELEVERIEDDEVNPNNRMVLEGAKRLGYRAGTFLDNRTDCVGSGYCLVGCSYDAKIGTHLSYLPAAVKAGAQVYTDCRAERIEKLANGRLRVRGTVVERFGRVPRLPFTIEAERVVLAAGAVHSPAILKNSGLDRALPELGRNVSLQPQTIVSGIFDDATKVVAWRGVPQSVFCSEFDDNRPEHGMGGFRLEGVFGSLGHLATALPGFGHAHKELMAKAAHIAGGLLLTPDRPSGEMNWSFDPKLGFRPRIRYRMSREWLARMRRGLAMAAKVYFAAGARRVLFPSEIFPPLESADEIDRVADFPVRSGVTRFISAHVQGTCRMSLDARRGVVDQDHRVHGEPRIYVVDASVMPTTASTHTMIPIMAMADRAAHRMLGS